MPDIIVPRKCVAELRKLLDELEGTVEISMSPTKIRFGLGSAVLDQQADRRHLPGLQPRHPDRERQAAEARPEELRGRRRPRLDHRQREDPGGEDERRSRQGDLVRDLARNGTATEEIAADYGSDGIEIGFNARYLLDILGEIDGDTVEVHLADAAARRCFARTTSRTRSTSSCRCGSMICRSCGAGGHPGECWDLRAHRPDRSDPGHRGAPFRASAIST